MADFSAQSASLSTPSGVGGPVVTQKVNEPSNAGAIGTGISVIASLASKAGDDYLQVQQYKAKQGILGSIAKQQDAINQGVASGQLTPQQAHAMSMSSYSQSIAAYPMYASEINQLHGAFGASTQQGDTDKIVQEQRQRDLDIQKQQDNLIMSEGYSSDPASLDPATRATYLSAIEATEQTRKQVSDMQAKQTLASSQQSYQFAGQDQQFKVEDRARQQALTGVLTQFTNSQMDAYDAKVQDLRGQVQSGKLDYQSAVQQLSEFNGKFQVGVQAIAGVDKEFATPYKGMIDDKFKLAQQLLDPKADAEAVQAKYNAVIGRQKLMMVTHDPHVRAIAAASQILPNNPMLGAAAAPQVLKVMADSSNTPTLNGVVQGHVDNTVGNPTVEGDAIQGLKTAIGQYAGKGYADQLKASGEINNTINNWLVQVGDMYNKKGVDGTKLAPMANFFASPEYGKMMQEGKIDKTANEAAKMTFQKYYEPAVTQAIGTQMNQTLPGTNQKLFNVIDAKFDGLGIKFVPRAGIPADQAAAAQSYIDNNMSKYATGMTTAVRMGSHMGGRTDYQQYWEDNKSILLPQLYPVAKGQVVNGAKFNGGDYRDPASWTKVGNGNAE